MTINATFVKQLPDGTSIYTVTLNDPEHLDQPIVAEVITFDGEIIQADSLNTEGE